MKKLNKIETSVKETFWVNGSHHFKTVNSASNVLPTAKEDVKLQNLHSTDFIFRIFGSLRLALGFMLCIVLHDSKTKCLYK